MKCMFPLLTQDSGFPIEIWLARLTTVREKNNYCLKGNRSIALMFDCPFPPSAFLPSEQISTIFCKVLTTGIDLC